MTRGDASVGGRVRSPWVRAGRNRHGPDLPRCLGPQAGRLALPGVARGPAVAREQHRGARSPRPPPGACPTHPLLFSSCCGAWTRGRRGDVGHPDHAPAYMVTCGSRECVPGGADGCRPGCRRGYRPGPRRRCRIVTVVGPWWSGLWSGPAAGLSGTRGARTALYRRGSGRTREDERERGCGRG